MEHEGSLLHLQVPHHLSLSWASSIQSICPFSVAQVKSLHLEPKIVLLNQILDWGRHLEVWTN